MVVVLSKHIRAWLCVLSPSDRVSTLAFHGEMWISLKNFTGYFCSALHKWILAVPFQSFEDHCQGTNKLIGNVVTSSLRQNLVRYSNLQSRAGRRD
jgi:hypothetical protein